MRSHSQSALAVLAQTLVLGLALTTDVLGCGMDWSMPKNYFEGVSDETGAVSLWDSFGDLDLGNGEKLPLYYNFESGRTFSSPYLGDGWYLPLLESRIVQQDENTFKVIMPNGKYYWFWRDKNNPNILNGQQNWKAEVRENSIVATAECGGKATFVKGKLISFSTKGGKVLDFLQENGRTSEIRSGTESLLKVESDPATGEVMAMTHGAKTVKLELGQRPQVQSIKGQNLVAGTTSTLTRITLPDGASRNYDFAVNDKIQPTLKAGDRELAWDGATRKILKDGEWSYSITDLSKEGIMRKNGQGQLESWFYDGAKGQETAITLDGTKTVRNWFLTGKSRGSLRKVEVSNQDKKIKETTLLSYDEQGREIRRVNSGSSNENEVLFIQYVYPVAANLTGIDFKVSTQKGADVAYLLDSETGFLTSSIDSNKTKEKEVYENK